MYKKVILYLSVIFLVNTVLGSPTTTITLQQGVDGYEGYSWLKMLSPSSPGAGNNKYLYKFIFGQMLTALYECWGTTERHEARSALKFDLSSVIPSNATITEATLSVYRYGNPFTTVSIWDNRMTFELYKVTKSWTQPNDNDDGPTMFNNWTKLADSYDPLVVDSVPYERLTIDWFTFDVKDAVQDFLENPSENHGLMLFTTGYVEPKRGGSLANINNPDDKDKNFRPKVTITYTTSTSINNNLNAPLKPVVISTLKDNLFQISSSMSFDADITINSINGSVVHRLGNQNIAVGNTVVPLKKRLKSGLYIVKVRGKGVSVNQKIFAIQ